MPRTVNLQALAQRVVQAGVEARDPTSPLPPVVGRIRHAVMLEAWCILIDDTPTEARNRGEDPDEYMARIMADVAVVCFDDSLASIEVGS